MKSPLQTHRGKVIYIVEHDEKELIASYLLGKLSEDVQVRFEQQYFSDDEMFQQLLMVEESLITRYVEQTLSEGEREAFKSHFLNSPGRRFRLARARALRRKALKGSRPSSGNPLYPKLRSWRRRLVRLLRKDW